MGIISSWTGNPLAEWLIRWDLLAQEEESTDGMVILLGMISSWTGHPLCGMVNPPGFTSSWTRNPPEE
jgi:hypothetical protein